jgi:hypothetical protein
VGLHNWLDRSSISTGKSSFFSSLSTPLRTSDSDTIGSSIRSNFASNPTTLPIRCHTVKIQSMTHVTCRFRCSTSYLMRHAVCPIKVQRAIQSARAFTATKITRITKTLMTTTMNLSSCTHTQPRRVSVGRGGQWNQQDLLRVQRRSGRLANNNQNNDVDIA